MALDLDFWGMVLQAIGLALAAVRDLVNHHAAKQAAKIRATWLLEVYVAATNDVDYEESTQEKVARRMAEIASKFDDFLPYSIAIAVIGTLMQIAAKLM